MNTNSDESNTLSTFKEKLIIENEQLLENCNVENYYTVPNPQNNPSYCPRYPS